MESKTISGLLSVFAGKWRALASLHTTVLMLPTVLVLLLLSFSR